MDDLLVKYLLKETDAKENVLVEQWVNDAGEHKQHFRQLKQVWESSATPCMDRSSEDEAWMRFRQRIQTKKQPDYRALRIRWMTSAAVLLIVISGGWFWIIQHQSTRSLLVLASQNKVVTDTLSDNTIVTLNENSNLYYPKKFKGKTRSVRLQGEAFFNVRHQSNQPFVVQVNNLTITDIGTSFNVNAQPQSTEIIVSSGIVKVTAKGKSVMLKANEKITVSQKYGLMKKEKVSNELYNYYLTKEFICNRTSLKDLIATLNDAYHAQIIIANPHLEQMPITTTFHRSQPLDSILSIISQTFENVSFSKKGSQIILK